MPPSRVVVWGNCQAAPIADLLRAPLASAGLDVVDLPPVYLLTPADVADVHARMPDTALLVSQPIRDEYRVPGCSTDRLANLLPPSGLLVTYPLTYYSGGLPYQVTANDAAGARVPAPLTEYHDLRLLVAARRGLGVADVLATWPVRASDDAVRAHAATSLAELARRERTCDVTVSDLVAGDPTTMFTLNHPRNALLAEVARRILRAAQLTGEVMAPEREYLGAVRTPLEGPDAPADTDPHWTIGGRAVGWGEVVEAHLDWYRSRPGVVADGLSRNADRLAALELGPPP